MNNDEKLSYNQLYDLVSKLQSDLSFIKNEYSTLRAKIPSLQEDQEFFTDEEELPHETYVSDESEWNTKTSRKNKMKHDATVNNEIINVVRTPANQKKRDYSD